MKIVARIVPRATCVAVMIGPDKYDSQDRASMSLTDRSDRAMIFPCESFAQDAIDRFMIGRSPRNYHTDIIDLDDPERGSLEPLWTGP